jgi:cytochrome c biogenesis protein CcmG, thiol:disulfide interchange protein DsbE
MPSLKTDSVLKLAIGVLLVALTLVIVNTLRERLVSVGDSAPDFSVTASNGRTITPTSFGGRLLVVNFWASWCPPCIQEMPSLNRFSQMLAGSGVVVLGISIDKDDKAYRNVISRLNLTFPTARDPEQKVNADFGTFKYPETYVINTQGKVLRKFIANYTWDDETMLSDIKSLL